MGIWLTSTPFMAGALLGKHPAIVLGVLSVLAVVALTLLTEAALPVNEFPGDLPKRLLFGMASSSAIALLTRYG